MEGAASSGDERRRERDQGEPEVLALRRPELAELGGGVVDRSRVHRESTIAVVASARHPRAPVTASRVSRRPAA